MTTTQPPLDQPLYGATMPQAVSRFFRKYLVFSGRASRSEFWWVYLFIFIVTFVLTIGTVVLGAATQERGSREPGPGALVFAIPLILFALAIIIPAISLHVRRLHDVNLSGLLYLITFVPYIGSFALLVLAVLPSNPAGVRFDAGAVAAPDSPYGTPGTPAAAPGYTPAPPAPPVQAGPPAQAAPPPPAPPTEPTA